MKSTPKHVDISKCMWDLPLLFGSMCTKTIPEAMASLKKFPPKPPTPPTQRSKGQSNDSEKTWEQWTNILYHLERRWRNPGKGWFTFFFPCLPLKTNIDFQQLFVAMYIYVYILLIYRLKQIFTIPYYSWMGYLQLGYDMNCGWSNCIHVP